MKVKNKAIILAVTQGSMSTKATAAHFNVTERWVQTLVRRYLQEGDNAFASRSKRPLTSPNQTPPETRDRILQLRSDLVSTGLDAGADSIRAYLENEGILVPSRSTVHRILRQANAVIDQPQKRPNSSLNRFVAVLPNEMWQADFTHWTLADGTDTEVLDFIDDHSRFLISLRAYRRVTVRNVVEQFSAACEEHGRPQKSLTDNGLVFTTRFAGRAGNEDPAKNQFEKLLHRWDVQQINGSPNHPQTQGKIERFHRTLKQWLRAQPRARSVQTLNKQLTQFQQIYNHDRPHRAIKRKTPASVYSALPKATPVRQPQEDYRIRNDTVDKFGKLTIRYDGKLRHLGMGATYSGIPVRMMVDDREITVIHRKTGEILRYFEINVSKNYQKPTKRLSK
ncbi:IS481 family transposase [Citricoccus sp. NR2]|uniref:IS481 family transposase n=1 Tax=Citricoccus sp. NR2 TaxID=3004095 RepID=UPI0022DD789C|nr:IS481 family transposase [Citricoccus sp. NR2]WBL19179.1 IS481 family transposase [Citricoccus sp. NR2]WBL19306.1 IS481 family transposase [Citricoccus sp. NR2]WBL19896.1 IS481 family transposase [Citricoccus sp. NR2]